jgi:hypothetical protein
LRGKADEHAPHQLSRGVLGDLDELVELTLGLVAALDRELANG